LLSKQSLKDLLHQKGLNKTQKLLLCIAVDSEKSKSVKEIISIAKGAGLQSAQGWGVSALLGGSKGKAIRTDSGWELTSSGKETVKKVAGAHITSLPPKVAVSLRSMLSNITDADTSAFVGEAIHCFEAKLYRAAVVLSWVGAVSVLYQHIIDSKLSAFNAEAKKRNLKWKDAKIRDDLGKMKEHDFLEILEAISVLGKSVKQELQGCLKLRNACGHPSSLKIGEHRVSSHIEVLILNVFSQF